MKSSSLFLALLIAASSAIAEDRPNLVFLFTDDQSSNTLGCYGNPDVKTPNIDQLATDGIAFDRHYDTTAICMASRANVMTGMFEYKTGCNFEHGALLRRHWKKSYPMLLREAGYRTAFAGKFGFEVADKPNEKGILPETDFDLWGGGPGQTSYATAKNKSMAKYAAEYPHSSRSYGAFGRDFIRQATAGDAPYCLSISFKAPHHPVTPDPLDDHVYAGRKFSRPANYGRENGQHFSPQSREGRQYERFESWGYADNYDGVMALYNQQIFAVDTAVGMIRDAIIESGEADNTVIIFTSDNGFFCGAHGYGSKVLPYEEGSRVPLIILDPRHKNSGRQLRCGALTGNIDIAPTLLDLAGLPAPKNMDGKSLLPLYDDPAAEIHESLSLINVWGPKECHSLAIVTRDDKMIYWPWADGDFEPTEEIYHLGTDPGEMINVIADPNFSESKTRLENTYDKAVAAWKRDAVPYHGYTQYSTIFDRKIPWADKQKLYSK